MSGLGLLWVGLLAMWAIRAAGAVMDCLASDHLQVPLSSLAISSGFAQPTLPIDLPCRHGAQQAQHQRAAGSSYGHAQHRHRPGRHELRPQRLPCRPAGCGGRCTSELLAHAAARRAGGATYVFCAGHPHRRACAANSGAGAASARCCCRHQGRSCRGAGAGGGRRGGSCVGCGCQHLGQAGGGPRAAAGTARPGLAGWPGAAAEAVRAARSGAGGAGGGPTGCHPPRHCGRGRSQAARGAVAGCWRRHDSARECLRGRYHGTSEWRSRSRCIRPTSRGSPACRPAPNLACPRQRQDAAVLLALRGWGVRKRVCEVGGARGGLQQPPAPAWELALRRGMVGGDACCGRMGARLAAARGRPQQSL